MISTPVPGAQSSRSDPLALVSTSVRQPAAAAVRTAWTTAAGPWPSKRCVRPSSTSTRWPDHSYDRSSPACPGATGARKPGRSTKRDLGDRLAERVGGTAPARAEHDRDVMPLDAGGRGERDRAAAASRLALATA